MVIVTCNLYYLGFVWVLEGFQILIFWKFINFFLRKQLILVRVTFLSKDTKHPGLYGEVGFFPTSKKNFWVFSNYRVDLNCAQNGLRGAVICRFARFCEKLGSRNSRKIGVRFMSSKISP